MSSLFVSDIYFSIWFGDLLKMLMNDVCHDNWSVFVNFGLSEIIVMVNILVEMGGFWHFG